MQMQTIKALTLLLALAVSYRHLAVLEQPPAGDTSGPAAGTPVEPSTVVQKKNPYISRGREKPGLSGTTAGAPGVEGGVNTQSGPAPAGRR